MPSFIGALCSNAILAVTYLGAFSRLTNGRFTPQFHEYQLARAPNEGSTWFIPYIDIVVGTMTLFPVTKTIALSLFAIFQGFGIAVVLQRGINPTPDIALFCTALLGAWSSYAGWP